MTDTEVAMEAMALAVALSVSRAHLRLRGERASRSDEDQ